MPPPDSGVLRVALIGCGEVTRAKHLPALMRIPRLQVVSLCDLDLNRSRGVAARFGIPHCCQSVSEVLSRDEVDAVGICTDPSSHPELAVAALRAGKHVLVEKPLALSPAECRQMVEAAGQSAVVAMTGFHMRFHRLVRRLRTILLNGAAGPVESIRLVWHSPRGDDGIPEWKTSQARGGGALVEIAVHHLDLVRHLTGDEIDEVFAFARRGVREDECAVLSARTSGGVLISGEFSERSPHEIEITVSGREGWIRADCLRYDGLQQRTAREVPGSPGTRIRSALGSLRTLPDGLESHRLGGDYRISYQREWEHFAMAIQTGTPVESTFLDGLRATEAVSAALESTRTGSAVRVIRTALAGAAAMSWTEARQ